MKEAKAAIKALEKILEQGEGSFLGKSHVGWVQALIRGINSNLRKAAKK